MNESWKEVLKECLLNLLVVNFVLLEIWDEIWDDVKNKLKNNRDKEKIDLKLLLLSELRRMGKNAVEFLSKLRNVWQNLGDENERIFLNLIFIEYAREKGLSFLKKEDLFQSPLPPELNVNILIKLHELKNKEGEFKKIIKQSLQTILEMPEIIHHSDYQEILRKAVNLTKEIRQLKLSNEFLQIFIKILFL